MAVCLLREGERRSTQPQSPETRRLPRVTVLNRPVVAAPHWRGALRARTPTHVSYTQPEREEVWKESFQRRKVQRSECGFHGPAHRPYKDVGHVELDDPTLILDGLCQKQDKQLSGPRSPSPAAATPTHISPPPPSRPPLRSMAPQLPDDLSLLPDEMKEVEGRRGEVKVGRSLFESVSVRETVKKEASSGKEIQSRAQTTDWQPPDVTFDPTVLASRRTSVHVETRPSTVTFDLMTSSHGNRSRSERRGSQQVAFETSSHDNLAHSDGSHGNHQTFANRPLTPGGCVTEGGVEEVESEGGEGFGCEVCEVEKEGEGEGEEGDGERDGEPGAQQSELVYQWYRQLCVLLWVMDGLKLDSVSLLPPFAKCWQLDRGGVQRTHSQAVSRDHTSSRNQQRYNLWKDNTFPQARDGSSPRSGTAEFNPLNPPRNGHMTSESLSPSAYRRLKREAASREEQRMRQQKRLTAAQMEALVKSVDEELNFSKKAANARVQSLQEAVCGPSPSSPSALLSLPHRQLAVERVRERFTETEVTKTMTVHHQLLAMQRDRSKALGQRLAHLDARSSLRRDLSVMRQGVKIESTAMARNKLLVNFNWFQDLLERIPDEVRGDRYCSHLLSLLAGHAHHSAQVGPNEWSKKKLIGILSTLRPWELRCPETAAAVKFLTEQVIYILPEDFEKWLDYHTTITGYSAAAGARLKTVQKQT